MRSQPLNAAGDARRRARVAFVGVAAVVVRNRGRVQGLTTAASLLATAGIGAAVALDLYVLALGVSLILFLVLSLLSRLEVKRHQPGAGEVDRGTGGDCDPLPD